MNIYKWTITQKQKTIEKLKEQNKELTQYIEDYNIPALQANIEETIKTREELEQIIEECRLLKFQYEQLKNDIELEKIKISNAIKQMI